MFKRSALLASVILTFSLHSGAFAAGGSNDLNPLKMLIPPVTVKGGPITGTGDDRKAEMVIKNEGEKAIARIEIGTFLLRADGSVSYSVPMIHTGFIGEGTSKNCLGHGGSYPLAMGSTFLKPDVVAIDGLVTQITFEDKTTWPALPSPPPEKIRGEPVAVRMIGVLGTGDRAKPVVACLNQSYKAINSVYYNIEYLDAAGRRLKATNFGDPSGHPIMQVGGGVVFSGGDAPPQGTTGVRVKVTRVIFADRTEWRGPMGQVY